MTTVKKLLLALWGSVHGTAGTVWALAGWWLAVHPDSSAGTKEWTEDRQFVPVGYAMLAIWATAVFLSYYSLRKNKVGIKVFSVAWLAGVMLCISFMYFRFQYMLG